MLLKWLESLRAEPAPWSVTVAGCGDVNDSKLSELAAKGIVKLEPFFGDAEWFSLIKSHDFGLFTSEVEGWGLALQEMLEAGLQVYATRAGAVPDLQPYFESQLHSFPPTVASRSHLSSLGAMKREYLDAFDWVAIAQKYIDEVAGASRTR